ncbi:MAG: hypothetical protein ACK5L5_01915 [Bacteroidales bacterium]
MRKLYILLALASGLLIAACENSGDEETFGPDVELMGFELFQDYDTIRVEMFKMYVRYNTNNNYALEYAINPQIFTDINDINITLLSGMSSIFADGTNMNKYFLVDDDTHGDELYQTIGNYTDEAQIRSLNPSLVFTNQYELKPNADAIIPPNSDTLNLAFAVQIDMTTRGLRKSYVDTLKCTLIP